MVALATFFQHGRAILALCRQDRVCFCRYGVRKPSGSLPPAATRDFLDLCTRNEVVVVRDLIFILLTLVIFGVFALIAKGAEKL